MKFGISSFEHLLTHLHILSLAFPDWWLLNNRLCVCILLLRLSPLPSTIS